MPIFGELEAKAEDGYTAFLWACAKGNVDCIRALAEAGCDTAARNCRGMTGLMLAAGWGSTAAAQAVLDLDGTELEAKAAAAAAAAATAAREREEAGGMNWTSVGITFPIVIGLGLDHDIIYSETVAEHWLSGETERESAVRALADTGAIISAAGAIRHAR